MYPRYVAEQYLDPRYVAQQYVGTPHINLPEPSDLSPESLKKSGLSNASADDSSSVTYLGFCILAIIFILLTGAVTYALLGSSGAGGDGSESANDSVGKFGGSDGFPSGDHGPVMDKDGITIAGGVLRPYGIGQTGVRVPGRVRTTTTPAPEEEVEEKNPVKEFICTVGAYAVVRHMYPKDGLCDYLYYTEVGVFNHKITFTEVELSWTLFQQQAKYFQKTGLGISFDARYVTALQLKHKAVKAQLNALAANNIKHYGLLNVRGPDAELKTMFANARLVIEELKGLQSDASLKVIIAIGILEYNNAASLNLLNTTFKTAVEETLADTVILISSSSGMDHEKDCYAIAPLLGATPLISDNPVLSKFPSLKATTPFVMYSFPIVKETAIVGLSMEMGVKTYVLKDSAGLPNFIPYAPCESAGLASANIICSEIYKIHNDYYSWGLTGYITGSDKKNVFFAESFETIAKKVRVLKNSRLRKRFAWLLYNVHLTDIEGRCGESFHARVSELKKLF